jgi:hypothetical protein
VRTVSTDPLSGLSVDSPAFRRNAPRVMLSDDPDTATIQTVQEMCRQINQAVNDPMVQRAAQRAVKQFRWMPPVSRSHEQAYAQACWWWCKHYLKFKHHGDMFEMWSGDLGDPRTKLQLLIAPDVLVRMNRMEGDCAIYTMMLCAMLRTLGLEYQVCPCAVDHSQSDIFSHVFARVVLPDGTESLDASHGPYPGWQVPKEDLLRLWVFDQNGNRISGDSRGFTGLHAYRRNGMGDDAVATLPPSSFDSSSSDFYNPTQVFGPVGSDLPYVSDPSWGPTMPASGVPDWSSFPQANGGYTAPSQNSAQWASFASNLAKMGFTLAQINAIQPGTVVQANGTILRQNPGYSVPVGSTIASSLGSGNTLLYVGVGLVGLLIVGSMFKK